MDILKRIISHKQKHENAALNCCDFIINKKELNELIDDALMKMSIPGEQLHEIRCMEYGYVGDFMGVKLYLLEINND